MTKSGKITQKVLIIGAGGMLGSILLHTLTKEAHLIVRGTIRTEKVPAELQHIESQIISNMDICGQDTPSRLLNQERPDIVINAAVVRPNSGNADRVAQMIEVNSVWPHKLANATLERRIRLVHISTDGVFSGRTGCYRESDQPDPNSPYTISKLLGEPSSKNCLVLRTSLIGQAPCAKDGLVDWFVRHKGDVSGHRRSIFSGFPTTEMSTIIRDHILPNPALVGIFHLASDPISKFELLKKISKQYALNIEVIANDLVEINRSLNGHKFHFATGYVAPTWDKMIQDMHNLSREKCISI
jgi:dTDP-4-dehydrorhamnose reductase